MNLTFETELEDDGRWLAEVPGCMAYGATETEAVGRAEGLALRVRAERIENGESTSMDVHITIVISNIRAS